MGPNLVGKKREIYRFLSVPLVLFTMVTRNRVLIRKMADPSGKKKTIFETFIIGCAILHVRGAHFMHGRRRMAIDLRVPTRPGRSTSGLNRPSRHC